MNEIIVPCITEVSLTPNPSNINMSFLISASITEITIVPISLSRYCGDFECGSDLQWQ